MKLLGHMIQQHLAWEAERAHLDGPMLSHASQQAGTVPVEILSPEARHEKDFMGFLRCLGQSCRAS